MQNQTNDAAGSARSTKIHPANKHGLPAQLQAGMESLSGMSLDHVQVHYNSDKPAQLQAHAYAQGSDIHLAPGQEKHLPHEAWHVVQQAQGRVRPTLQMKQGVAVNDDVGLEQEADVMGARALAIAPVSAKTTSGKEPGSLSVQKLAIAQAMPVIQRAIVTTVKYTKPVADQHKSKMAALEKYLDTSLAGLGNEIKKINIDVMTRSLTDPARTDKKGDTIEVYIGDWFVISASVGDLCGMIAHEIGVHTLANDQMGVGDKSEEKTYEKIPFNVNVGWHTHTISPWDDKNKKGGRQQDHVNVVRDKGTDEGPMRQIKGQAITDKNGKSLKGGPYDEDSANRRAEVYANTMLGLGDAIDADNTINQEEKDQRLHDLLNSFLFDYGRMLAGNDVALRVIDKTPLVAQVFNWYKNVIITRHSAAHGWLLRKTMQPEASTWGLRAYLLGRMAQSASAKVLPESVHNLGAGIANVGGQVLGGLGSVASAMTPGFVKKGLNYGLRTADFLYGEAENQVFPRVTEGLGWVGGKALGGLGWAGGKAIGGLGWAGGKLGLW
ncbi:DUF4157 domain-containing protein [Undibacterium sp. Ji50W]|uniref:eCIS core domain-containing protein n=1 Tax=Undibacterium sp. Ji50W TaxID=3413041 RepID=UPI003BF28A76